MKNKKTEHTPGPWKIAKSSNPKNGTNWRDIQTEMVTFGTIYLGECSIENSALVSAAPDLLAALETITDYMVESHQEEVDTDHHGDGPSCSYCRGIAAARAAIAKARGVK